MSGPSSKNSSVPKEDRLHAIEIADFIIHRYSEHDALLKKADKAARDIINESLREGEAMRALKLGSYQLYFPKLTPDAGALRCSVIAEQVYREVRRLNPATAALENKRQEAAEVATGPTQIAARDMEDVRADSARREAANRALARMAEQPGGPKDEISFTDTDKEALATLGFVYQPVWHTKNNLITAYKCALLKGGRDLSSRAGRELLGTTTTDLSNAKIDAHMYARSIKAVQFLAAQGLKALLIVPIHFSTVDRLKFIGSLLDAGRDLPDTEKNLIVFEILDLPPNLTKFRLREPIAYLRTRARALICRPGFDQIDLAMYKEFNFHGVSVDLGDYDWKESQFLKGLEQFAINAEKAKLQSFVHGISSSSLAVGAVAAGITYMDGNAISEPVNNPSSIRAFEIDMLFDSSGA